MARQTKLYRQGVIIVTFESSPDFDREWVELVLESQGGSRIKKWLGRRTAIVSVENGEEKKWVEKIKSVIDGVVCATLDERL